MEGLPLPREGATPTHVRSVAWAHAHRAHQLAGMAEVDRDAEAVLYAAAAAHAQVALALLAVVDTASSGWRAPGA